MACGNGEKKVDDCRHRTEHTDLQSGCAEARGIHVEKVDGGAAQYAEPCYVEIKMGEVGAIFLRNVGLSKNVEAHGEIITIYGLMG